MSETNKTLRIHTSVGNASNVSIQLNQSYDTFEILSLKLREEDVYKLHSANYGVIVGRVEANGGFGVPNAKISIFIEGEFDNDNIELSTIYPYTSTTSENGDGVRYNLLPDNKVEDCHQIVGTFPNKTYLLDNDVLVEVFDKYYIYTTRTNNSGDYILCGVPTGNHTLHMDLDLSDCGILSQRPRDFVYKGYTIEQFENPNQFKTSTELDSLSQIFTQDQTVNVIPFWGNEDNGETIGLTRADISVAFKFEPTCVFIGSVVADNSSNGIGKKCVPTNQMGAMDELTTGEGTIEMIRYTPGGSIEEFQIKGTQLINGNGVWCYQIPMNLDYMMTDEYGNMVPTDDPSKGIPTRTRVRFRISLQDTEQNIDNYFRAKVLVPHNPQNLEGNTGLHEEYDYEFGSDTREESFRDLMWNNVYTVKSYIPRFQKSRLMKTERFTGIKHSNIFGNNNPMPYNNIRIRLPLMFTILCALIKTYIRVVYIINNLINFVCKTLVSIIGGKGVIGALMPDKWLESLQNVRYLTIADGLCPDLDSWYFAPAKEQFSWKNKKGFFSWLRKDIDINVLRQTFNYLINGGEDNGPEIKDPKSIGYLNADEEDNNESVCLTIHTDYLISCIEMALAQEYKVINFDFYNDWVNGVIYMPRWMRYLTKKRTYLFGLIKIKSKVKGCMDNTDIFNKSRFYVQQCALSYSLDNSDGTYTKITNTNGCTPKAGKKQKCHKEQGRKRYTIFGGKLNKNTPGNGGIVHEAQTTKKQYVYYLKPCEWRYGSNKKTILFANDIVLLGSLNDCNIYGIPQAFKFLTSSSYIMPTNLALTNMDDDGQLYTGEDGTMCSGTFNKNNINYNINDRNKTLEPIEISYSGTTKYYNNSSERIEYGVIEEDEGANIFDDTIPITEAAGISWNYTGPGQGTKSDNVSKSLYMPGGHFLGISCVNSETNIKSCINLQRICEVGANMSQRREVVRAIDDGELRLRYFVPTGLISNDDINGGDFRTMFATMNHNRLLCKNSFDEKTGYPIYDFIYLRNVGFNGALKNAIMHDNDNQWNKQLNIIDEKNNITGTRSIAQDVNYDTQETAQTFTRTLEINNVDYYKFRMGLNSLDVNEQNKRFLMSSNNNNSLPQYENSFYFYFGLKDGSTAFDEFNKQFFSTCESTSILRNKINVSISTTTDTCELTGTVHIKGTNSDDSLEISYSYYTIENGQEVKKTVIYNDYSMVNDTFIADIPNLAFGEYEFTFTDDNSVPVVRTVILGDGVVSADVIKCDFGFKTSGMSQIQIVREATITQSGYIEIGNVTFGNETVNNIKVTITQLSGNTLYYYGDTGCVQTSHVLSGVNATTEITSEGNLRVYLWASNVDYSVYLWNTNCQNGKGVYFSSYFVDGVDNVDLYLGSLAFPYSTSAVTQALKVKNTGWWSGLTADTEVDWFLRYALFRRTEYSADTFTNKVFGYNKKTNANIPTVLFGQPEKSDGSLYPGYYCETDTRYEGVISDNSIIPTWPDSFGRKNFSEMAVINNTVVCDKVQLSINSVEIDGNLTKIKFYSNLTPNSGYIIKFADGTMFYGVFDGSWLVFENYGGYVVNTGQSCSVYSTFVYPVMYKPFYAETYSVDWVNPILNVNGATNTFSTEFADELYRTEGDLHNGLTYGGTFGDCSFNDSGLTINRENGTNDLYGRNRNPDTTAHFTSDNFNKPEDMPYQTFSEFSYSFKEKSPENVNTAYTTPYEVNLLTIEQSVDISDMATSISYRENGNLITFYNDKNDITNDYYIVPSSIGNSLVNDGYLYNAEDSNVLLLCRYADNFDSLHNVTEGTNEAGKEVLAILQPGGKMTVQYKNSNGEIVSDTSISLNGSAYNSKDKVINRLNNIASSASSIGVIAVKTYHYNNNATSVSSICKTIETRINSTSNTLEKITFNVAKQYTTFNSGAYIVCYRKVQQSGGLSTMTIIRNYSDLTKLVSYSSDAIVPTITLTPTAITFESTGGTNAIEVNSNVSWTFTIPTAHTSQIKFITNGVETSVISGDRTQEVTIKAEENTSTTTDYTATLECKYDDDVKQSLNVKIKKQTQQITP